MMTMLVRDFIRRRTTFAFRETARSLLTEYILSRRHWASYRKAKRKFANQIALKLHFGSGQMNRIGWVNIDLYSEEADLQLDAREPLPFPDHSASIVYTEHFFEHLEYPEESLRFLRESWRVLTPGGTLSTGVPDVEVSVRAYMSGDEDYYGHQRQENPPKWITTRMDYLNRDFRSGGEHKYAYDFETLARVLTEAGFTSIAKRSFNSALDSPHREWGTLYVDAKKPSNR
jgi:predicted SAM-dependent methyltransferase